MIPHSFSRSLAASAVALCLCFASPIFAADTADTSPARPPWEHLSLTHDLRGSQTDAEIARMIVKLGKEGWELVSVANSTENGTTTKTAYYFKRRL
jgi:hypothetical protein